MVQQQTITLSMIFETFWSNFVSKIFHNTQLTKSCSFRCIESMSLNFLKDRTKSKVNHKKVVFAEFLLATSDRCSMSQLRARGCGREQAPSMPVSLSAVRSLRSSCWPFIIDVQWTGGLPDGHPCFPVANLPNWKEGPQQGWEIIEMGPPHSCEIYQMTHGRLGAEQFVVNTGALQSKDVWRSHSRWSWKDIIPCKSHFAAAISILLQV